MRNLFLYLTTVLIWGSTWFVITFQLTKVDPVLSVAYRFALASLILFLFCIVTRRNMKFKPVDHGFMALQGLFSFSIGYWFVYLAELRLASGLVAVITSSLIFMNIFNGWMFGQSRINRFVFFGALVGMVGILLVFRPEISSFSRSRENTVAMVLAITSTLIYSFGNIIVVRNQNRNLPVMPTNAFSMGYGAVVMFLVALLSGKPLQFDFSFQYMASLAYLAVFGSVVAFYCYFSLIGNIGADKAAYGPVVIPAIALAVSAIFEGYRWSTHSLSGVALLILGNLFILSKKTKVIT